MAKQNVTYKAKKGQGFVTVDGEKFRPGETRSVTEKLAEKLLSGEVKGFKFEKADSGEEPESTSESNT